ncbi:MAG TPA: NADP-dependent phosphogluconate dehydrogenase [Anaerolineaceae bacterium]
MDKPVIGVVGLGVMGHSLVLNMERNGFAVMGFNRSKAVSRAFMEGPAKGKQITIAESDAALVAALDRPRRILLMVPAGDPVESVMRALEPHLEPGDVLIDGGNSFFLDTERRLKNLEAKGLNFIGMGVSGGEEGALWGPSLMPGGSRQGYDTLEPILKAIAAKADDGQPCVEYIGPGGAGHYVKMVHNGIEYGDMQLIAEVYDLFRRGLGLSAAEMQAIFIEWDKTVLHSYLIEITAKVLGKIDEQTGKPLVDLVLDEAQQKGTGKWTSQNSFDIGAPVPTINAAVESRILSSLKEQRVAASKMLHGPSANFKGSRQALIDAARDALYAAKITSYAQGMGMLTMASKEYHYDLKPGEIAKIWRAGCIIRADLLGDIMAAYQRNPALPDLLLDDAFRQAVEQRQDALRLYMKTAIDLGIPALAMGASLAYYDSYRSEVLPANLTQAQRDFFGAHTYRRIDMEGVFHTDWEK